MNYEGTTELSENKKESWLLLITMIRKINRCHQSVHQSALTGFADMFVSSWRAVIRSTRYQRKLAESAVN